ncbi:ATP synthase F(0) complex subunit k, mitochondrial [Mantella aurantiaca]
MAGHDSGNYHFTGFQKYFNAYTIIGRRNCVLATYGALAAIVLFFKLKPKKQKAVTEQ